MRYTFSFISVHKNKCTKNIKYATRLITCKKIFFYKSLKFNGIKNKKK